MLLSEFDTVALKFCASFSYIHPFPNSVPTSVNGKSAGCLLMGPEGTHARTRTPLGGDTRVSSTITGWSYGRTPWLAKRPHRIPSRQGLILSHHITDKMPLFTNNQLWKFMLFDMGWYYKRSSKWAGEYPYKPPKIMISSWCDSQQEWPMFEIWAETSSNRSPSFASWGMKE